MTDPEHPQRIGPYTLQGILGEGGSAWVYRAYDPRLERRVALKVLKLPSPEWVARLRHEALLQARLHHPHLAQVFEVGEEQGRVFLAMQLIPGETLAQAARGLDLAAKVRILVQAADAVHAAHRQGLIHRDLKPANILVGRDDVGNPYPYVVDFGLARIWEGQSLTAPGQVLGSPAYMAPEQAQGWPVDPRTDVYGLGATLFEALTGRPPFEGQDVMSLLMRVVQQEAPRLRTLLPTLPPELEAIVERCLQKDPAQRYPSSAHLRADLERFLDGEPILARPIGPVARARKWVGRNRLLAGVAGLSAVAILALGGLLAWSRWSEARRVALAQRLGQEVAGIEGDLQRAYLLPPHDVAPIRAEVRGRVAAMARRGDRMGRNASGPIALAMGRALLLMEDFEGAHPHLERALALGEGSPEASRAFGLVCASLYREGLKNVDPTDKAGLAALQSKYRDPALTHLARGREASGDLPVPYLEAQLAACDGKWEEARAKTAECRARFPFFFQAYFFEGELCIERAAELLQRGKSSEGMALVDEAEAFFRGGLQIARSYPRAYTGLAACWFRRLDLIFMTAKGDPAPVVTRGTEAYDESLRVDSESILGHSAKALFLMRSANLLADRSGDPFPLLRAAEASAVRALALKPEDPLALRAAFYARLALGNQQSGAGQDPTPVLAEAMRVGEALLKARPGFLPILKDLGLCASMLARHRAQRGEEAEEAFQRSADLTQLAAEKRPVALYQWARGVTRLRWGRARQEAGQDPAAQLKEAVAAFQQGLALNPTYPDLFVSLGEALTLQGLAARRTGRDPEGDWAAAETHFQAALALVKEHPEASVGLSEVWLQRALAGGSPAAWRQARAWAERCTRRHPKAFTGWLALARVERLHGEATSEGRPRWIAAQKAAEEAQRLAPGRPELAFEAVCLLHHLGRGRAEGEALASSRLEAFLAAYPKHPSALALKAERARR